jgi:gliding motility-associated-like protein
VTNLNYKTYQQNAFDLLMDINENNANLLNDGDPIPGLDMSLGTEYTAKYRVTAVNKTDNDICSVSNIVKVNPELYMYLPNAFTPNEDGLNDSFGALGYGVKDSHLPIYNRWGQLIFESNSQDNQWDGTYHGQKSPIGSYIYTIDSTGYYNQDFHKEGMISIVKV